MSFGKMNGFADIVITKRVKDNEGFSTTVDEVLASVRVRRILGLTITTDHILVCEDGRFEITSVEDVKGRGMYIEVLAKKVVATQGAH